MQRQGVAAGVARDTLVQPSLYYSQLSRFES